MYRQAEKARSGDRTRAASDSTAACPMQCEHVGVVCVCVRCVCAREVGELARRGDGNESCGRMESERSEREVSARFWLAARDLFAAQLL